MREKTFSSAEAYRRAANVMTFIFIFGGITLSAFLYLEHQAFDELLMAHARHEKLMHELFLRKVSQSQSEIGGF